MEVEKGPVCVTGGTAFISSWLVMKLLQNGYTVRTTVRPDPVPKLPLTNLKIAQQTIHTKEILLLGYNFVNARETLSITTLPRASEKLHIFNGDMNQPESFSAAIEGCIGVFHVAHPMPNKELDEESVTKKSVEGTIGILKPCRNAKTVKRVVYTSSAATVSYNGKNKDIVDESSWSDIEYHRSLKLFGTSYVAAKTKTEQGVLEFAEKKWIRTCHFNPSIRPWWIYLQRSPWLILSMILGNADNYTHLHKLSLVHVDDLVNAHIFLLENSNAKGS